ncbi:DUF4260 family protein [Salinirussus salinus]|jgi:hypothetical protein|uniref:DUF4260 family protein n=1 Tax=Salinirussus salinus TaxID=1198300 RepID=UPI0013586D19|nr:DUF4260 family protein [Salinirussus salinus]
MDPRQFLRVEGLAALAAALGVFLGLEGPLWLLAVLALAPDLSMLGYLGGPRAGSLAYNLAHTYTLPLALAGIPLALARSGTAVDPRLPVLVAAVWAAHIGADRLLGYGLKFETGFRDTHLSTQPAPVAALADAAPGDGDG